MKEKIKVLMVDDEARFRATTKKILTRRGFETILAASGEEAVDKLHENPDVVILDIKMPGMDGHETLREIQKRRADLPVIMLTGHGQLDSAKTALAQGAFDYLAKPCDIDVLAAKIAEACQGAKQESSSEESSIREVMIPIEDYTALNQGNTIEEAIFKVRESFSSQIATSKLMETGHRSLLVFDDSGKIIGILSIRDLLKALRPAYLGAPKPSMADSIQYSPMFWSGMFKKEVKQLAAKKIKDVMSPAPSTVDIDANLMEAAHTMITLEKRRLAVTRAGDVVGVIREQDLFFEIDRILKK